MLREKLKWLASYNLVTCFICTCLNYNCFYSKSIINSMCPCRNLIDKSWYPLAIEVIFDNSFYFFSSWPHRASPSSFAWVLGSTAWVQYKGWPGPHRSHNHPGGTTMPAHFSTWRECPAGPIRQIIIDFILFYFTSSIW